MRTAPIGVLYSSGRIDQLIGGAYEWAIPTHGGQMAICAAAAVAAAVSAALDGLPAVEVLSIALKACEAAEPLCPNGESPKMADAIRETYADLAGRKHLIIDELAEHYFPNKPRNIVPLALALALVTQSAQETILLAANIGGDSDSVASIGGAVAGAIRPETVNEEWFGVVRRTNSQDLIEAATLLAALRS
jgi:ADP-ribosylglycohydrolase